MQNETILSLSFCLLLLGQLKTTYTVVTTKIPKANRKVYQTKKVRVFFNFYLCLQLLSETLFAEANIQSIMLKMYRPTPVLPVWLLSMPVPVAARSKAARLLRSWVRIPRGHGYLSVVSVVCCQVEVSATR